MAVPAWHADTADSCLHDKDLNCVMCICWVMWGAWRKVVSLDEAFGKSDETKQKESVPLISKAWRENVITL